MSFRSTCIGPQRQCVFLFFTRSQHEQYVCQSVEGLAELAGKLEGEVTGENYTVAPSKSDQRDSVKEGWHESAPNLADIGAKLVVGTSDHRDAVKVTWQKQRAEPSW